MTRSACAWAFVALGLSCVSVPLNAQAWLGPKGEVTVSLGFQHSDFKGHVSETGERQPHGTSKSRSLDLGIDYAVSDKFALSASLPYVASRNGEEPSPVAKFGGNDDGRYHSTWQDYHLEARYNVLSEGVVLTPFVGFVIPSHRYAAFFEAGAGRDLREAQVGINIGRLLTPKWHQPYVEAKVLYAVPERVFGISTNRVGVDGSLGLFITPSLSIRGVGNWQRTSGGLTADEVLVFHPDGPPTANPNLDPELFRQHDRLLQDRHFRAGLAASWSLNAGTDVYAGFIRTVSGRNTHYGTAFSIGIARTLKPRG